MINIPITIRKKPLGNFNVTRQIHSQMKKGFDTLDHYSPQILLNINKKINEEYDLSRAIKESYGKIKGHFPSVDNYAIEIRVQIYCDFEKINIESEFPQYIGFNNCIGNKVIIKESNNVINDFSKLTNLTIFNCEIKNLEIYSNISSLIIENLKSCNSFVIEFKSIAKVKMNNFSIKGQIKEITVSNVTSDDLSLDIEDNKPDGFETEQVIIKISNSNFISAKIKSQRIISFNSTNNKIQNLYLNPQIKANDIDILNTDLKEVNIFIPIFGIEQINFIKCSNLNNILISKSFEIIEESVTVNNLMVSKTSFSKEFIGFFSYFISNKIVFENCINRGELNFENMNVNLYLQIINSVMGKMLFINSNIGSELRMKNSNIEDVKLFTTELPSTIHVTNHTVTELKNIQDAYRQLKVISEKSSNKEKVIFYRSKELDTYYESLSFLNKQQILEKITIGLNRISNRHTLNWGYPLFWLIFLGTINFIMFLYSLGAFSIDLPYIYIIDTKLYSYLFDWFIPGYLYPTRNKIALILETFNYPDFTSLPLYSKLIVFENDILLLPYCIYQFIAAFRRHGIK
ncbi:hypothetical protein [Salmonirosea aquatica]|uniref:Uncharacterized protein n=1 Tax=Salmonirosea aquatica TaxID=2654236 RepID=A0A7C9FRK9_9BACT|nr:hypothetical protein [Cytophagaceae bacterium SJW1-29]